MQTPMPMPSAEFRSKLLRAVAFFKANEGKSGSAKLALNEAMMIMGNTPRVGGGDPICRAIEYFAADDHPPFLEATCILSDAWEWSLQQAYFRTISR